MLPFLSFSTIIRDSEGGVVCSHDSHSGQGCESEREHEEQGQDAQQVVCSPLEPVYPMTNTSGVVFLEGEKVWYRGPKSVFPIELTDLTAKMVLLMNRQVSGMNGAQLARELSVTPSAITKAAKHLVKLGIIRRD